MTKLLFSSLTGLTSVLLLSAVDSEACGTGTSSITGLSDAAGDTFLVAALSAGGPITGYFYGAMPHAFLYNNGVLKDLGTLGGSYSQGMAINALGQVAGGSLLPDSSFHAFLYSAGQMTDLGTLGGTYSNPGSINDNGAVVGTAALPSGDTVAFLYTNGPLVNLGTLGGTYSSALGINNAGVICGESSVASGDIHGFVYNGGAMADVGTLGGGYSSCSAINAGGTAVGQSTLANGANHAFSYSAGTLTDLGTLGGSYSSPVAINGVGQVVGSATTLNDQQMHGFIFTGGSMVDLGSLGGGYSAGFAINNQGQVVGESSTTTGATHAFIWQNGTMADLNASLPPNSGWELFSTRFINDSGRIVGVGLFNGAFQWFILDLGSSNQPPVACAGPNQTVDCLASVTLDGSCSIDPDGDALMFQWSTGGTVLGTNAALTASFPLGTNVITLQVTDVCGASSQTNVTVIVADTTPPTITCPAAVTASSDANCQAAVPDVVSKVVATDNCTPSGSLVMTQSPAAGTLVGLGPHPIAVTVSDDAANSSQCSVLFTVVDTKPPTIVSVPGSITLSAGANCQATVPNVVANVVATDNCTPANQLAITQNPVAGTIVGTGQSTIVVTVTDASGNSSTANVSLSVSDTTPPSILSAPGPVTVSAGGNCQGSVPNFVPNVVASDNCTAANQLVITQSPAAGTLLPLGQHLVTITVTDAAGNSATAGVSLVVADTTPPVISSVAGPIALSADANCQAQVPNVVNSVVASDNCTPASALVISQSPAAGTLIGVGASTILVTVADASGNSAMAKVSLTVADTTPPTILSVPGPVTVSADANCQGTVPNLLANVVATDNCTPANQLALTQNPAAGTLLALGQYVVNIVATDASGNTSSAGVSLTVADTTPPVIKVLSVNPSVLSPPNHQLVPVTVAACVTDSCDSAPVSKIINITCSEPTAPGDIQITGNLTATLAASKDSNGTSRIYTITVQSADASGNTSTGSVIVTVPKSNGTSNITSGVKPLKVM